MFSHRTPYPLTSVLLITGEACETKRTAVRQTFDPAQETKPGLLWPSLICIYELKYVKNAKATSCKLHKLAHYSQYNSRNMQIWNGVALNNRTCK